MGPARAGTADGQRATGDPGSPAGEHAGRLARTAAALRERGEDLLVVGPSADLAYLTGLASTPSERLKVLLVSREGGVALVLPAFEVPLVDHLPVRPALFPWEETTDPLDAVRRAVADLGGVRRAAVGPQLWAVFLLRLQAAFPEVAWSDGGPLVAEMRMRKSSTEVDLLRAAARVADRAYEWLVTQPLAGRSEREVLGMIHDALRRGGMDRLGGGIVGAGPNGASPHHKTGDRPLGAGEAVVLDYGGQVRGYWADITRTPHVGPPGEEFRRVYRIVQEAQQAAVEAVRPGVPCEAIDRVAREYITRHGFGPAFLHRTGHGIGLDGHEEPYLVEGNRRPLEPGMTISIEPGIYLAGRFGVRIEDIVVVTTDGAERLNTCSRDLTVVT